MSINTVDYLKIACALEVADALQQNAAGELITMENNLSNTLTTDANASSLKDEIEGLRSKIAEYRSTPNLNIVEAVRRLQAHVEKYNGPINTFLSGNAITVSPFFASLSLLAGYKILSSNISISCV